MWKKIWQFLDGNKTIIGEFLLLLLSQSFMQNWIPPEAMTLITWLIITLTGASLVHHVAKGKFTTKKN